MNVFQFKTFVIDLIKGIVEAGDARAQGYLAQINDLSAKCDDQAKTIEQLQSAIAANDKAKTDALAAQAQEQADSLNTLSSELAETFNPTPVADAVAEAVQDSTVIPTPDVVAIADSINEPEVTPAVVTDAAVEAIGSTVESITV